MTMNWDNTGFCTYFDKNYLPKGISMIRSLQQFNPLAKIWVLCFDHYTYQILKKIFKTVNLIKLANFEDTKLKQIKNTRSLVEYYWTTSPSLPLYLLKQYPQLQYVTYLDADLLFFSSLEPVFQEMGNKSIYTVEHRYSHGEKLRNHTTGRFNVGFQIFRRDKQGIACLKRWRKQCLEWCYWRKESGKMGDQYYLNEWPDLYTNLVISQNTGINAAPWNITQYQITSNATSVFLNHQKLICYHYHQFAFLPRLRYQLSYGYLFSRSVIRNIYKPYLQAIDLSLKQIREVDRSYCPPVEKPSLKEQLNFLIFKLISPTYWNVSEHIYKARHL